jgi:hypothetical protein
MCCSPAGSSGVTTTYHFLFVPLTIGLAFLVAIMQVQAYRTKDETWERLTRFFGTLFLINFAMGIVAAVGAIFATLFPRVMVSSGPGPSLTIWNAASANETLLVMTVVAAIFVPLVLAYQGWSYWVFRQRLVRPAGQPAPDPPPRPHSVPGLHRGGRGGRAGIGLRCGEFAGAPATLPRQGCAGRPEGAGTPAAGSGRCYQGWECGRAGKRDDLAGEIPGPERASQQ